MRKDYRAGAWQRGLLLAAAALVLLQPSLAAADARSQAKRLHDRLAGVPAPPTVLAHCVTHPPRVPTQCGGRANWAEQPRGAAGGSPRVRFATRTAGGLQPDTRPFAPAP